MRLPRSSPAQDRSFARLGLLGLGLLGLLAGACGGGQPQPPVTRHIKLMDELSGVLNEAQDPFEAPVLIRTDFAEGLGEWDAIVDLEKPIQAGSDLLSVETGKEGEQSFITLGSKQGAICRVVPVQPLTVYAFEVYVRAHELVPAGDRFFGAAPHLLELTEFGTTEALFEKGIHNLIANRGIFRPSHEEAGWKLHKRVFRTGETTRALLVACVLGLNFPVQSGSVDFRGVSLVQSSTRRLQEDMLEAEVQTFGQGEPALQGWHAKRRIKALQGTEVRPSLLLFPGESMSFDLRLPERRPYFEAGLGAWRPALKDQLDLGHTTRQRLRVSVSGEEVVNEEILSPTRLVDTRWRKLNVDLTEFAGQAVRVTLSNEGDLPGVFGAAQIREAELSPADKERLNLVLISIDTLRSDHLGSYGYEEETSPNLDALAERSVRFSNVISQGPWTLPSHASLFSGQFSSVHGIRHLGHVLSSTRSPVLARILSDQGYRTQAFTGGGFVNPLFGFDKGFDGFRNMDPLRQRDSAFLLKQVENEPERYSKELIAENGPGAIKDWLSANGEQPFFLFLHTYTVHDYDPPKEFARCAERGCTHPFDDWHKYRLRTKSGWKTRPYTEANRQHLNHTYDDSLLYVDHLLGDIFEHMDSLGLSENTIIAITSDHGEELLERGFVQHGKRLYEEGMRIPILLHVPGVEPAVDERHVMQIDLMPTLLAALGLEPDVRTQGIDLLDKNAPERVTWSEVRDPFAHRYTARSAEGWKLIHSPPDDTVGFENLVEWELYDLNRDAGELHNLAASELEAFATMQVELERMRELNRVLSENMEAVGSGEMSDELASQLKDLGYVDDFDEDD